MPNATTLRLAQADAHVFGTVFVEVILPGTPTLNLPGWQTRLWPTALFGDATLEASPLGHERVSDLLSALNAAGVTPLGRPNVRPHSQHLPQAAD